MKIHQIFLMRQSVVAAEVVDGIAEEYLHGDYCGQLWLYFCLQSI
jgi:hypothetical protein